MAQPAPAHERPRQPGRIRSILLALGVHAAFLALIVFGVSWQSHPTPPLQAELWSKLPTGKTTVLPKAAPKPPEPEPPKPEPKPEPRPEPPPPEPPKAQPAPEPPKPDPEIAERKAKQKREAERRERERLEKAEAERKAREKKEAERKEKERKEAERKERERKEAERKEREAKARAEAEAAQARAQAEAAEKAQIAEIDAFTNRIRAKIRGKANVPDTVRGRPVVVVHITVLPGGGVLEARIEKPSGNPAYDDAIMRAIRSASPLPVPPADSELFPRFRSLTLNIEHER